MSIGWSFPDNNYSIYTGIGEAGIETFKGSPLRSLAREICQNSMDARLDKSKPVVVEFSAFTMESKEIPDYLTLKGAILSCLEFGREEGNKKTIKFFDNAKKVIENNIVNVLRISDFNTTGLQGSDKEYGTPWNNLVKSNGVSGKEGSAGGSFGIGKSAPFACSDLRTLFYATKDNEGLSAFQGIAKLVSFKKETKKLLGKKETVITTGTGFYGIEERYKPVTECKSLDPRYQRVEYGTDIFVVGFNMGEKNKEDWKTEIIISVLEEFLLAIYNGELTVKVDEIEINSDNIGHTIENYKENAKIAYNYYQVLTDENSIEAEYELPGLGTVNLRVLIKQGLHRKVMMCRKNGMKIFDKGNISGTVQFAGICVLKGEQINEYFRELENPQHNAWEPERHSSDSKTKAKNNISSLYKFVKNTVIDIGKKTTVDEVDAEGMGEYFADTEFEESDNQGKNEAVSSSTKNIEIDLLKMKKGQIGYEYTADTDGEYFGEQDMAGFGTGTGGTGSKDGHGSGHNKSHNGTGFGGGEGGNPGTNGDGDNSFKMSPGNGDEKRPMKQISMMAVRLFQPDRHSNIYIVVFEPKKTAGRGYLQINLSGEQNSVDASVIDAVDMKNNVDLECKDNKIYLNNIERNTKNRVRFRINYAEECSLEVKLYGYSL